MSTATFDLTGIGNALVDVLSPVEESFIGRHKLNRGGMTLIDEARALELYDAMPPATEVSGGSAGNTMAAFASLGGHGAYIGKIGTDQLGDVFAHDLKALGVTAKTARTASGAATGRCLILVTQDGERTMNTFLGAAVELSPADIDEATIAASAVTYLEGYLFDPPLAMEAFYKAAKIAHDAGRKVALSLSDAFCVHRHRDAFLDLVKGHVDILFANQDEIKALYGVNDLNAAISAVRGACDIAAITRDAEGSVIVGRDETATVPAERVARVVDSTGAGDVYAAGFLYGHINGMTLTQAGRIGSIAAAEIISHIGPRPLVRLSTLLPGADSAGKAA